MKAAAPRLRAPRLANVIAHEIRELILAGELADGEPLPSQERLMARFRVSQPSIREALRILETDGLVTVRRGKRGGAIVHLPTSQVAAGAIASILQARKVRLEDVGRAIQLLEPICCELAAGRPDRQTEVVPALRRQLDRLIEATEDPDRYLTESAAFHQALVQASGNETLVLLVGALESVWAAHARSRATSDDWPRSVTTAERRRYGATKTKLLDAIQAGDAEKARSICGAHLEQATRHSLVDDDRIEVRASVLEK